MFFNFFVILFCIFIKNKYIGLNRIFLINLKIALNGNVMMLIIVIINFFIIDITFTTVLIIKSLSVKIYIVKPIPKPKNIKSLKLPSEKLYIQYIMLNPVNIQNMISSTFVIKFIVLKDFLKILKKSNKIPIKIPFKVNIKNKYA